MQSFVISWFCTLNEQPQWYRMMLKLMFEGKMQCLCITRVSYQYIFLLLGHTQRYTHALHWCAESRHQHVDTVGQLRAHTERRKCLFFILFGKSVLYQQTLHPPWGRITGLLWRWLRRIVGYRHIGISSGYYWGWWKRKLRFCQWIAPPKSEKRTRKFQSALSCTS